MLLVLSSGAGQGLQGRGAPGPRLPPRWGTEAHPAGNVYFCTGTAALRAGGCFGVTEGMQAQHRPGIGVGGSSTGQHLGKGVLGDMEGGMLPQHPSAPLSAPAWAVLCIVTPPGPLLTPCPGLSLLFVMYPPKSREDRGQPGKMLHPKKNPRGTREPRCDLTTKKAPRKLQV